MRRKEFILRCGRGCLALAGIGGLLVGCAGTKYVAAEIEGPYLIIPLTAFEMEKDGEQRFRRYVVAENNKLEYPICVYRVSAVEYTALLMRCTHQGTELQVFGDRLQCPAHGSEFSTSGDVQNGPADISLRKFKISSENGFLKIDLS